MFLDESGRVSQSDVASIANNVNSFHSKYFANAQAPQFVSAQVISNSSIKQKTKSVAAPIGIASTMNIVGRTISTLDNSTHTQTASDNLQPYSEKANTLYPPFVSDYLPNNELDNSTTNCGIQLSKDSSDKSRTLGSQNSHNQYFYINNVPNPNLSQNYSTRIAEDGIPSTDVLLCSATVVDAKMSPAHLVLPINNNSSTQNSSQISQCFVLPSSQQADSNSHEWTTSATPSCSTTPTPNSNSSPRPSILRKYI